MFLRYLWGWLTLILLIMGYFLIRGGFFSFVVKISRMTVWVLWGMLVVTKSFRNRYFIPMCRSVLAGHSLSRLVQWSAELIENCLFCSICWCRYKIYMLNGPLLICNGTTNFETLYEYLIIIIELILQHLLTTSEWLIFCHHISYCYFFDDIKKLTFKTYCWSVQA